MVVGVLFGIARVLIFLMVHAHLNMSAMEAGTAENCAEDRKCCKYAALAEAYQFEPIALETIGVYFESTGVILRAMGRRLVEATGEPWRLTVSIKTWL